MNKEDKPDLKGPLNLGDRSVRQAASVDNGGECSALGDRSPTVIGFSGRAAGTEGLAEYCTRRIMTKYAKWFNKLT